MGEENDQGDVVITYETLFEIFRREKSRGELQELEPDFFDKVIKYLSQKHEIIKENANKDDMFADEERLKAEKQLHNIKKVLSNLYEMRERKILEMALNKARSPASLVDDTNILKEEKPLFNSLIDSFKKEREGVLNQVLNGRLPQIEGMEENKEEETTSERVKESTEDEKTENTEEDSNKVKVKFTQDVSEFVGPEMETLGPYSKDDVESFRKEVADILLDQGSAEKVE